MAELVPEAWFYGDANLDPMTAAEWNFELMDRLGTLAPGSPEYEGGQGLHAEVAKRREQHPPHRPMTEKPATVNPRGLNR